MSAPPLEEVEPPLGELGAKESRCRSLIRASPDWPRPGTTFLDISPLLCDPFGLQACVDALVERYKPHVTHVAGIDARGFPLGCAGRCYAIQVTTCHFATYVLARLLCEHVFC